MMKTLPERDRPWWVLPHARVHGAWWLALAVPMLWIEYITGLHTQFPMVYFIPVSLAAWYPGRWPAVALGVIIPIAQLIFMALESRPESLLTLVAMTMFRGTVIIVMALGSRGSPSTSERWTRRSGR